MKIINFGSLNIDHVHRVEHFAEPGQTVFALHYQAFPGGKGLNQSIAAARAGAAVLHAGSIGSDGRFFLDLMQENGVDASCVQMLDAPSGHTAIEINRDGQNRIVVYGGTNQMLTERYVDMVLENSADDDLVLLQNETNLIDYILCRAHERGLKIAFNPSPMPACLEALHSEYVNYWMVNEFEAAQLAGMDWSSPFEAVLETLGRHYAGAAIIMTLGQQGVLFAEQERRFRHPVFPVRAVDTTGAGDTFCGYFLAALCRGAGAATALREASAAAAIAVTRAGAVSSIPAYEEVAAFLSAAAQPAAGLGQA